MFGEVRVLGFLVDFAVGLVEGEFGEGRVEKGGVVLHQ